MDERVHKKREQSEREPVKREPAKREHDKRKEVRLPIALGTTLKLRDWPLPNPAVTLNLSVSGALLRFKDPIDLEVGEIVACEFAVDDSDPEHLVQHWAECQVMRVQGTDIAVRFRDSSFAHLQNEQSSEAAA